MLSLGAGYGLLYHFIIMPLIGSELVHCLGQGVIFGLKNYLMSIGLYKRYHTLKNSNKLLKKKLDIDKLTGLLNRGAFDNDIMGLSLDESYSIIFIDIDNFRKFNNEFGHQVGVLVLQKVSREIRNSIRVSDKAYRYGGEEIVILLKDCNRRKTLEIAEKVRLNINELNNNPYPSITISLGVASYPDDGKHADEIIKASDNALLTAKRLGKNQVSSCAV